MVIPWYLDLYMVLYDWYSFSTLFWSTLCFTNTKRKGKKNMIIPWYFLSVHCFIFWILKKYWLKTESTLRARTICVKDLHHDKNWDLQHKHYCPIFFTCSSWCWTFSRSLSRHPRLLIKTSKTLRLTQTTCRFWHLLSSPMTYWDHLWPV